MKITKSLTLALLIASLGGVSAFAHEGHDKTPGAISAPHGGVIQATNSLYWEMVAGADGVKLYPITHEEKAIAPSEITLSTNVSFPKKPKPEAASNTVDGDHFLVKVDTKGAYRYTLELSFSYKGKKEKTKFQVEPQN